MPLYRDRVYSLVYYVILVNIVKLIIPLTVLTIFNIKLIKAVRASREMHSETQRQQNNTTVILVTIVITFIICFTPYLLQDVLWTILLYMYNRDGIHMYTEDEIHLRMVYTYTFMLGDMFLAVNSAVNFLIYLARGERFRRILKNICLPTILQ